MPEQMAGALLENEEGEKRREAQELEARNARELCGSDANVPPRLSEPLALPVVGAESPPPSPPLPWPSQFQLCVPAERITGMALAALGPAAPLSSASLCIASRSITPLQVRAEEGGARGGEQVDEAKGAGAHERDAEAA